MFETMLEKESNIQASAPVRGCARKGIDEAARASACRAAEGLADPPDPTRNDATAGIAIAFPPSDSGRDSQCWNLFRHATIKLNWRSRWFSRPSTLC
jgi:hypothetical protein